MGAKLASWNPKASLMAQDLLSAQSFGVQGWVSGFGAQRLGLQTPTSFPSP